MEAAELLKLISLGETSFVQFKRDVTNEVGIAQEMVAFSNNKGGKILIGIDDKTGNIVDLSFQDIQRINSTLVNAAQNHVKSPIKIECETIEAEGKKVIIATIEEGTDKPYMDKEGLIFIKNGADKRKVTSKEELMRLLKSSGNLYAEEMLIRNSIYEDINEEEFKKFYEKKYKIPFKSEKLGQYIENLGLGEQGKLNLVGALLFTKHPIKNIPSFFTLAIWFKGLQKSDTIYLNEDKIEGTLSQQYKKALTFLVDSLREIQIGDNFNSKGELEIPVVPLQELLINALVHRDYFIKDTIKVFVFNDRVEIISPGVLPNNLTEEKIRLGIRKKRNPLIDSFAFDLLDYKGAGSGILRALQAYPDIDFINDKEAEEFKVIIKRPQIGN
jgi:predicted HTH transcriptional regulator